MDVDAFCWKSVEKVASDEDLQVWFESLGPPWKFALARLTHQQVASTLPTNSCALPDHLLLAAPSRQLSYRAGRLAASGALQRLGFAPEAPGVVEPGRLPHWPNGSIGSITHTMDRHSGGCLAGALVLRRGSLLGVGVDCESLLESDRAARIAMRIAQSDELAAWAAKGIPPSSVVTAIFSAKESVYKALLGLTNLTPSFHDAEIGAPNSHRSDALNPQIRCKLSAVFKGQLQHLNDSLSVTVWCYLGVSHVWTATAISEHAV
jgi:4'-phosphopantetheinyl transferase EntD